MLLSRHWLNRYVDLKGIRNQQITEALNKLGFEVEGTLDFKNLNDPLVIGHIEESNVISNTHLTKNKVHIGGDQYLTIVCGDANVRRNQHVIVAKPGQKIANGATITPRKIHGIMSEGMICALSELGVPTKGLRKSEQDLIFDLGRNPEFSKLVGHSIRHLGLDDFLWDIDITLNRSDALSAFQLAKELAYYFDRPVKWPLVPNSVTLLKPKTEIKISPDVRPKVIALVGKSLEIRNGKTLLTQHHNLLLKKIGILTHENLHENLANLNAWETGQPLILLDRNKLLGALTLQMAKINGKELLVLTSNGELVQIIGQPTVANFAVDENTKTILAVALKVDEQLMREQSRHFESNTAFQRYTRPMSVALHEMGLKNYEHLLAQYRLLRAKSPIKTWVKGVVEHPQVQTTLERINKFLGTNLSQKELVKIFRNSDFTLRTKNDQLIITPNPIRTDIRQENDIMEEVARLYGYDNIPTTRLNLTLHPHRNKWNINMEHRLQSYLNALGFFNIKTYSLVSESEAQMWNPFQYLQQVSVLAPLSSEHSYYRRSLIASFLKTARHNANTGHRDFKFWEIADVYPAPERIERHLIFGVGGKVNGAPFNIQNQGQTYQYVKGIVEAILDFYQIKGQHVTFERLDNLSSAHPTASATVNYRHKPLGYIIRPQTKLLDQYKLPLIYIVELNLNQLTKIASRHESAYHPSNKFQASKRALSFVLPPQISFQDTIKQLLSHVHHLTEWKLIDQYQDQNMIANHQLGLTIAFIFNHADHQLTESEINHQWDKILANARRLQLKIR